MLQRLVINGPSVNLCHAADCIRDQLRSLAKCLLCNGPVSKAAPFPSHWSSILEDHFPLYARLPDADRKELQGHIQVFLRRRGLRVAEVWRLPRR